MPTLAQAKYVKERNSFIKEPILIVGAKMYDYDRCDFKADLEALGYRDITGIDLLAGEEVDYQVDLCDKDADFFKQFENKFNTIICMSVLMCVPNPFIAAENLTKVSASGASLLLSEPFIHKHTNMPKDHWRFTANALQQIFSSFSFLEDHFKMVITRSDAERKYDPNSTMIRVSAKHPEETFLGYFLRRVSRKFLSKGIFQVSLFPEIAVYALGIKK
jgi:hypothetical protein